jgi:hypothetical protein
MKRSRRINLWQLRLDGINRKETILKLLDRINGCLDTADIAINEAQDNIVANALHIYGMNRLKEELEELRSELPNPSS